MTTKYMYSDIDMELEKQTDGDATRNTGIDAVKNSIQNIVNTMQGSRRMLPKFAGYFQNLLFQPIDEITARELGYSLVDSIRTWDDRVIIENVHVAAKPDRNMYECTLVFRIRESRESETIKFVLVQN